MLRHVKSITSIQERFLSRVTEAFLALIEKISMVAKSTSLILLNVLVAIHRQVDRRLMTWLLSIIPF